MRHDLFGEILYNEDEQAWLGRCSLPAFAEYGREPADLPLEPPDEDFRRGLFPLTIQDYEEEGPTPQQANAFRFLMQHEPDVCRTVIAELHKTTCHEIPRMLRWLQRRVGDPYPTPEDLKRAARCSGVEISTLHVGQYAYIGFRFDAIWEVEHGLSVIFHPEKGAYWGDDSAIDDIEEADNIDDE